MIHKRKYKITFAIVMVLIYTIYFLILHISLDGQLTIETSFTGINMDYAIRLIG